MGGVSTSHSAVLADKKTQLSSGFDLRSWQGLTELLKVGKDALHDGAAYSEFRDLVLQYASNGGDVELRKKIDAIVATFDHGDNAHEQKENLPVPDASVRTKDVVKATSPSPLQVASTQVKVKTRRLSPQFGVRTRSVPQEEKVEPIPPPPSMPALEPAPVQQFTSTAAPIPPSASTPIPELVPEQEQPSVAPEEQKVATAVTEQLQKIQENHDRVATAASEKSTPSYTAPVEKLVQEIKPESVPETNAPRATAYKTIDEYKARIAEIKRTVNTSIGNPAALMDAHSGTGKTYMTALLTALKATGGGASEGIEGAMLNLEAAFEVLMAEGKNPAPAEKNEESTRPALSEGTPVLPEVEVEPQEEDSQPEPTAPELPHEVPSRDAINEERVIDEVYNNVLSPQNLEEESDSRDGEEYHKDENERAQVVPEEKESEPEKIVPVPEPASQKKNKRSAASTLASLLITQDEEKQETASGDKAASDAEARPVASPERNPHSKYAFREIGKMPTENLVREVGVNPAQVAVMQSELASPEITQMLNKLLHEWSIFGGSGLFGIGPGGSEHPLYQKLASLSMGEVVMGRWENADPKITRIIKEYVNAWRHEQGVAYVHNETFDHYLRRVVQRILKRQNG